MPIRTLDPRSAHAEMQKSPGFVFLDVRTPHEYDSGHPAGALNVPVAYRDQASGRMLPNPGFVAAAQQLTQPGQRVFVSCQAGGRSLAAAKELEGAGYPDVVNVDGGFGGRRGPSGQVVVPGWQESGLPVETTKSTYKQARTGPTA